MKDEVTPTEVHDQRGRKTARDILRACAKVLEEDGFKAATLERIAAVAGVSKGGLLYHFPTKDSMVLALVEEGVSHFDSRVTSLVDSGLSWLDAYVQASLLPLDEELLPTGVLAAISAEPRFLSPLKAAYKRWYESARAQSEMAEYVVMLLDGIWLHQVLHTGITLDVKKMLALIERFAEEKS